MLSNIWVWDPGSEKNLFRIPDPGFKKALDPGSRIRIRNTEGNHQQGRISNQLAVRTGKTAGLFKPSAEVIKTMTRKATYTSKSHKLPVQDIKMEDLEEEEEQEQDSTTPWSPTVVDIEERQGQDSTAPGPPSRTSRLVKSFRGYGLSLTVQEMVR